MTLTELQNEEPADVSGHFAFVAGCILIDKRFAKYLTLVVAKLLHKSVQEIEKNFSLDGREMIFSNEKDCCKIGVIIKGKKLDIKGMLPEAKDWAFDEVLCGFELEVLQYGDLGKEADPEKAYKIKFSHGDVHETGEFIHRRSARVEELKTRKKVDDIELIEVNLDNLRKLAYITVKEFDERSLEKLLYVFANPNFDELEEVYEGDKLMEEIRVILYDFLCELRYVYSEGEVQEGFLKND